MSNEYLFNGFHIPPRMMRSLRRYIDHGIPPGGFLRAVICNDLSNAVGCADLENQRNLPAYVGYLSNHAPANIWGSVDAYNAHIGKK